MNLFDTIPNDIERKHRVACKLPTGYRWDPQARYLTTPDGTHHPFNNRLDACAWAHGSEGK